MSELSCNHEDLDMLGKQATDVGDNTYFICKKCRAVIVVLPDGERAYMIPPVKGEDKNN